MLVLYRPNVKDNMNGVKLTERLIEDIERSIKTRNSVPDVLTQIKKIDVNGNGLADFVGAVNSISFDPHLNIVVNLINGNDALLNFDKNKIPNVLEDIITNKDEIAQRFQNILDNEDLVSLDNFEPLRIILVDTLDDLHGYSGKYLS